MAPLPRLSACLLVAAACCTAAPAAQAQSDPKALEYARNAVSSELAADANDHSNWMYRDRDIQPGKNTIARVVDTPDGGLSRKIEDHDRPLSPQADQAEIARINSYIHDSAAQAKDRKNAAHDDAQAAAMLRLFTSAFFWTLRSETPEYVTLDYRPNPDFNAPNMEARVMSKMTGEMIVRRPGDHIYSLKGRLTEDVKLGFGLVKLKAGGTFDVERREIAPGHWQIVEQHTHIDGHALLFKTISEQEDEWKTDFQPSPAHNLTEAARVLGALH